MTAPFLPERYKHAIEYEDSQDGSVQAGLIPISSKNSMTS